MFVIDDIGDLVKIFKIIMVLVLSISWVSQAMQQEQAEQERMLRKNSMLLHATTHNDFQQMLDAGADINGQTVYGDDSVLCCAIDRNKEHLIQMLLDAGANPNKQNGGIPLHRAICNNNIVQMLLDAGADVNVQDRFGKTALLKAVRDDRRSVVSQLLEQGADVNLHDYSGDSALSLSLFIKSSSWACDDTYEDIFDMLIGAGADVNYADLCGITPLYSAVHSQSENRAFRLLAAGADVNHRYEDGLTIFFAAVYNTNTSLVKLLLNWNDIIADWRNSDEDIDFLIPLDIKTVQDTLDMIQENRFNFRIDIYRKCLELQPSLQEYIDIRNAEQAAVDVIDIATHARIARDIPEVVMSQVYEYLAPRSNIETKHQVENSINWFRQYQRNRMQNPSSAAFDIDAAVL